eukprot:5822925-Pyramimonas_sp.AAC.1
MREKLTQRGNNLRQPPPLRSKPKKNAEPAKKLKGGQRGREGAPAHFRALALRRDNGAWRAALPIRGPGRCRPGQRPAHSSCLNVKCTDE